MGTQENDVVERRFSVGQLAQIEVRTVQGEPWRVGQREIRTEAHQVVVRWRGGGLTWLRPAAVRETAPTGESRIPIRDVTGLALMAMAGAALAVPVIGQIIAHRGRR